MEKKYVYANIKLPIIVNEDDTLEPMVEYLTMEFEQCDELPLKPDDKIDYSTILENLKNTMNGKYYNNEIEDDINEEPDSVSLETTKNDIMEQSLHIQPNEILHRKKKKTNMSLKNYRHKKHNITSANREDITSSNENVILSMLDMVVDSLPQPLVQEQLEVNDL